MPSLDGIQRPSLTGFKQASASAIDRAKLMVGLKQEIEEDLESQASERSFVDNAADLICPDLSFQQVRFNYHSLCLDASLFSVDSNAPPLLLDDDCVSSSSE